jgi:hypothetical protein
MKSVKYFEINTVHCERERSNPNFSTENEIASVVPPSHDVSLLFEDFKRILIKFNADQAFYSACFRSSQ